MVFKEGDRVTYNGETYTIEKVYKEDNTTRVFYKLKELENRIVYSKDLSPIIYRYEDFGISKDSKTFTIHLFLEKGRKEEYVYKNFEMEKVINGLQGLLNNLQNIDNKRSFLDKLLGR